MSPRYRRLMLGGALLLGACSQATTTTTPTPSGGRPTATTPGGDATPATGPGGTPPAGDPAPRPYDRVITAQAQTRRGLLATHRVGSRLYFELPDSLLGRELLVVPRVAKAPAGGPYGGQQVGQTLVVRFERREHRVLLRNIRYNIVADSSHEISRTVEASTFAPVVGAFNVESYGPDSAAVIDVTRLFTAPPGELGPGATLRGSPDAARSFIERVVAYPTNIEVEALLTGSGAATPNAPVPSPFSPQQGQFAGASSLVMHWSIVQLPAVPMMARWYDSRVGYFTTTRTDYSAPEQKAATRTFILRYRLEKRDPAAAISEPVTPIVYYVDPATPRWLVPYVKRGIEAWQPAFEAAGFRNAIVARDAPTATEDPDWSAEDARYSVVRWLPSDIANAQGPNVHDPRSGEILESDVYMYHNIMELQRLWYFAQVAHLDPRALQWPFPDDLMGRLVEYVVAHEVGHTIGFQHNHKASSTYPVDSLRSASWVRRMGHTPSLMDYARLNYLAQPGDGIAVADLVPGIGPYDLWATRWGYAPISGARTAAEERPTLDRWAREQDSAPWYRWNVAGSQGSDPSDQSEAVGDGDPVKATGWGILSLRQIVPLILRAGIQQGEDFGELGDLYGNVVNQWITEMLHVVTDVGGVSAQEKRGGQSGVRFTPLPRERQQRAVRFVIDSAFQTPTWLLVPEITQRLEVEGALRRINGAQSPVLSTLLNNRRMERMIEFEAVAANPADVYPLATMLAEVRDGLWSELAGRRVVVDPFRRELQRSYLAIVAPKVNPPVGAAPALSPRSTSDIRALFRAELRALDRAVAAALPRASDPVTRAHLDDVRVQIERILDPQ